MWQRSRVFVVQPQLFFAFRDTTDRDTLVFLCSETHAAATRVPERKWVQSTEVDIVNRALCNLCVLALWLALHIFATKCLELQQEQNSCPLLRSCFIGSCHVGVSKRFSRSISLAVFCLYTHFILADQISCRSYVGSVYRMWSLAVSYSFVLESVGLCSKNCYGFWRYPWNMSIMLKIMWQELTGAHYRVIDPCARLEV